MNQKPSVLIIDDDASTRKMLTTGLMMAGFPVFIASSAEEASEILAEKHVDVIVTDLIMRGYNGVDVIRAVREAEHTARIPLIVLTSGGNMELAEQAGLVGANEILQKHTTPPAKLMERIMKLHEEATKS
jgi:CheY-like chemotaxis protein